MNQAPGSTSGAGKAFHTDSGRISGSLLFFYRNLFVTEITRTVIKNAAVQISIFFSGRLFRRDGDKISGWLLSDLYRKPSKVHPASVSDGYTFTSADARF